MTEFEEIVLAVRKSDVFRKNPDFVITGNKYLAVIVTFHIVLREFTVTNFRE
jgi:hypothetical protein